MLKPTAQEMLDLSRFGCEILRLTRPKKKDKKKGKDEPEEEENDEPFQSHLDGGTFTKQEEIPKDQVPYGPIQLRFCAGAHTPVDPASAEKIAVQLENQVRQALNPYRDELLGKVQELLNDPTIENTETIVQYCEWVDEMDKDFIQVSTSQGKPGVPGRPAVPARPGIPATPATPPVPAVPPSATLALYGGWCCYFPEDDDERVQEMAAKLKAIFAGLRDNRLKQLAAKLSQLLVQKPANG